MLPIVVMLSSWLEAIAAVISLSWHAPIPPANPKGRSLRKAYSIDFTDLPYFHDAIAIAFHTTLESPRTSGKIHVWGAIDSPYKASIKLTIDVLSA
ncbi:MAG: hypothetical protein SWY16_13350 [Cyanobacteriota bacterium]|nr:hypothetical protein [Cyanobacteriota bacterium]